MERPQVDRTQDDMVVFYLLWQYVQYNSMRYIIIFTIVEENHMSLCPLLEIGPRPTHTYPSPRSQDNILRPSHIVLEK